MIAIVRIVFLRCLLVVWVAVLAIPQQAMSADCAGTMVPLILKQSRGGFAGTTGTVWTIAPDCGFTVSRFVNAAVREPHRRGQLTPEQESILSRLLVEKGAASLPATIGEPAQVNPYQIILEYGGRVSVLNLPPGVNALESVKGLDQASPERRAVEILETVQRLTGAHD
jgi:hypothetical protein